MTAVQIITKSFTLFNNFIIDPLKSTTLYRKLKHSWLINQNHRHKNINARYLVTTYNPLLKFLLAQAANQLNNSASTKR